AFPSHSSVGPTSAAWWEEPGPVKPLGLSRPNPCLWVASPGPASTSQWAPTGPASCLAVAHSVQASALQRPLQAQCLPPSGLHRPSSCLDGGLSSPSICCIASSPGPAFPPVGLSRPISCSRRPLQAQVALKSASPGPAPASRWPLQAQVILKSASNGPALASRRPLQVHNFLPSASSGPAPLASQWPSLCLTADPPTPRSQPHCSLPTPKLLPSGSFNRPCSWLSMASLGPAHHSQRPFWAQFVHFWPPLHAPNLLKSASPDPAAASRRPLQAQLFLPAASTGPTTASQQPL
uniref:DUF4705 domain-containing protein n=1 Tax=Piliocolobus tephrosceles TaxID=591936 RepID=A0A8C9GSJ6_9PRIM